MNKHEKKAREIGAEIRKYLFVTQPIRNSGPLVEPGLSHEANDIIAQALREAEAEGIERALEAAEKFGDVEIEDAIRQLKEE